MMLVYSLGEGDQALLCCDCGFPEEWLMPCRHIIRILHHQQKDEFDPRYFWGSDGFGSKNHSQARPTEVCSFSLPVTSFVSISSSLRKRIVAERQTGEGPVTGDGPRASEEDEEAGMGFDEFDGVNFGDGLHHDPDGDFEDIGPTTSRPAMNAFQRPKLRKKNDMETMMASCKELVRKANDKKCIFVN